MKKLLLLLSLLIGSNLIALEKEVSSSFESTWSKVLLLMSAEGAKISFIDKSSGLLKASLSISRDALNTYYYQCRPPGTVASITSDISVVVQEVSNDRSKIIINSKGVIESYRNRKLIFINTSKIIEYNNCDSTGEYEKKLLESLSKF
mgnify:FL=1